MSRKKDDARVGLRDGANAIEIIDFRDAKNSGKDSAKTNIINGISAKKMVNFRNTKIAHGINIDQFVPESIKLNVNPIDIKHHLQDFLPDAIIEKKIMVKLIQI